MRVRIKDIAEAAGVSPAAVSMALNDRPGIGDEKRKKILEIARTMRYDVERSSNLLRGKRGAVRFLYVSRHGHVVNAEHEVFIANYIDGLSQGAAELALTLEISTIKHGSMETILRAARSENIEGIVLLGTELSKEDMGCLDPIELPLVVIDNYDEVLGFDFVDMNNRESVYTVVEHLVGYGHRRIGLVSSYMLTPNFSMRCEAFKEALLAHGLECDKDLFFPVDSTFQGAYRDMTEILRNRERLPTALFCVNDMIALGCVRALKGRGLVIPNDISVVGFDNLPSSALLEPALTTIEVSKRQIGLFAIRLLYDRIVAGNDQPSAKVLVSGRLIERGSVKRLT